MLKSLKYWLDEVRRKKASKRRGSFSVFAFAKDKEEELIDDATPELEWVGNKCRLMIFYDDEEFHSWRASGLVVKNGKFVDYDRSLHHPEDWRKALKWLIQNNKDE